MSLSTSVYARLDLVTDHFIGNPDYLYACEMRGTLDSYWVETNSCNEFEPRPVTCAWADSDLKERPDLKLNASWLTVSDHVVIYESTTEQCNGMLWVKVTSVFSTDFAENCIAFHEAYTEGYDRPVFANW